MRTLFIAALAVACIFMAQRADAACVDNVVLVHGNAGMPSDWDDTRAELLSRGYSAAQIYRPSWGSSCPACNDHNGSEEVPVRNALNGAIAASCTGKIDVIGHSMGVTLAAREIDRYSLSNQVDSFVGIAGANRGLWTCGSYPWNVWSSTCGYWGLSVNSPFLNSIAGEQFGARMYSIKSWSDQVVCATGFCTVGGVHSSQISGENASYTRPYGHFGLLYYTADLQADLID